MAPDGSAVSDKGSVTSKDGTSIAYERHGSGTPVILVTGGLDDGAENAPLATELAGHFTVYNYNRRGRGDSGDTQPYALEREIEDIEALIAEAGGAAHLYGVSSGGALVLETAATGLAIERLAVYDVPYNMADEWRALWRDYVEQVGAVLAEGRRGDALALFMRLTGSSEDDIARGRRSAMWRASEALAHTLVYDAACLGDGRPPAARLARITQPTLVATGEPHSPGAPTWAQALAAAADEIAASIPRAARLTLDGQGHVVDPKVLAPVLRRFFAD